VGAGLVVKDHAGPVVDPPAFFATTCQEYRVAYDNPLVFVDAVARFDAARFPLT
jgi:hypothetical protein